MKYGGEALEEVFGAGVVALVFEGGLSRAGATLVVHSNELP
jgi:hypothetical protein